jgi:hypothetical protein
MIFVYIRPNQLSLLTILIMTSVQYSVPMPGRRPSFVTQIYMGRHLSGNLKLIIGGREEINFAMGQSVPGSAVVATEHFWSYVILARGIGKVQNKVVCLEI